MSVLELKKWYSDFVCDGGDTAGYAYVMAIRLGGVPFGNVAVHVSRAGGEGIRRTETFRIDRRAWGEEPVIGASSIRAGDAGSTLTITMADLSLVLRYAGRDERWTPAWDGAVLDERRCRLEWNVVQPKVQVRGTIRASGRTMNVEGSGYRDLVTMRAAPWNLPARRLLWGRAHCGEFCVVFNRLDLLDGRALGALLVRKGDETLLEETGRTDIRFGRDGATRVSGGDCILTLGPPRILERAPILTTDRIRPALLRGFMSRLCRDPLELKLSCGATLEVRGEVLHGTAIHELVTWGPEEGDADA